MIRLCAMIVKESTLKDRRLPESPGVWQKYDSAVMFKSFARETGEVAIKVF